MAPETCRLHPDAAATGTCEDCSAPLCAECKQSALGRTWCASCLATRLGTPSAPASRIKRPWLAFVLTMLPGLGQVYNGFVLRGAAEFGAWWLLVLLGERGLPGAFVHVVHAVVLIGFWYWCGVDAFRTARELNARGYPATREEARSVTKGPAGGREVRLVGVGLVVVGCLLFAQEIGGALLDLLRFTLPIALIGGGAWILHRARVREEGDSQGLAGGAGA